jgi:type IV pilus assembly protein PilY1
LANESATTRAQGTPIFYNLKVTQNGLLSLSYSTGGAYSYIIKDKSITASNGGLPDTFRFGFAGSTGGSTNVHEIMCFKAASANTSGSSATVNEKQSAKVQAGTQAYFAFYNPNVWTGALTANNLIDTAGVVSVASIANWDASCLLTTGAGPDLTGATECATTSVSNPTPAPSNRIMLTWDTANSAGIPFEWSNLNSAQKAVLDDENNVADSTATAQFRLNYLRGDTTHEFTSAGSGLYRARDGILGDIVDSSPSWVGPPSSKYTGTWKDSLQSTASMPENSGTQSYLQFVAAEQTRLNVVYTGANDGFLHGFRAGGFDSAGNFCGTAGSTLTSCAATPNDGREVLAYMPGSTLVSAALPGSTGGCISTTSTGTAVQNIHGWSPAYSSGGTTNAQCETPELDLSAPQYGHNFFVDATPGTGDLFYGGVWHTWLVGGLGVGGAAIYALNVTDPTAAPTNFAESNASNVVIGEWNSGSISCTNVSNCGNNLGNTFGTPLIRRLHNGNWGVIFGNGFSSTSGDAGIYVMSVDSASGAKTFYYLSTGTGTGTTSAPCTTNCDGIAYTTAADLDGDHITDYVYAGDLKGNVWRFDLHDSNPANWAAAASPLFTTPSGQPITTQVLVVTSIVSGSAPRLLIEFGTGQRTQITNLNPATFAGGTQALYGIWDWNLSAWNALGSSQYASLAATSTATGILASSLTIPCTASSCTRLTQQTLSPPTSAGVVDGTSAVVCWQGSTVCTTNASFGWYASLPSSSEQIIFNPVFFQGAILVNSTVPAANVLTSCTINTDAGYTYALSIANGGVFANAFPRYTNNGTLVSDSVEAGVQTNATGSVYVVTTAEGTSNIVYQTVSGTPGAQRVDIPSNTKAKRLTWIELR